MSPTNDGRASNDGPNDPNSPGHIDLPDPVPMIAESAPPSPAVDTVPLIAPPALFPAPGNPVVLDTQLENTIGAASYATVPMRDAPLPPLANSDSTARGPFWRNDVSTSNPWPIQPSPHSEAAASSKPRPSVEPPPPPPTNDDHQVPEVEMPASSSSATASASAAALPGPFHSLQADSHAQQRALERRRAPEHARHQSHAGTSSGLPLASEHSVFMREYIRTLCFRRRMPRPARWHRRRDRQVPTTDPPKRRRRRRRDDDVPNSDDDSETSDGDEDG